MGMAVGEKGSLKAEPNVVPMIDIMLVLLIIFMIVTPVIAAGFQAQMPLGENIDPRIEEAEDVVLGIDKTGEYYLNPGTGQIGIVPRRELERILTEVYQNRTKDRILYFKADRNLEFRAVQEAIEIARRAGVRVVGAVTDEKREGAGILGKVRR